MTPDPCPACITGRGVHIVLWDCEGRGIYGRCGNWHCATCGGGA